MSEHAPPTAVALLLALPGVVYLSGCSRVAAPPVSAAKAAAPKPAPRVPSAAEGLSVSLYTLKSTLAKPKYARALRPAGAAVDSTALRPRIDAVPLDDGYSRSYSEYESSL
jgi:hypothetical protein